MGTCCGYVNQKQEKDKTVYMGEGNQEKEIQDALDKLNDQNDQGETSSQRSYFQGSANNIQSMIQNHATFLEQEDCDRSKKEHFYGEEALADYAPNQPIEINLQSIANEEVTPVIAEKLSIEVNEQKKTMLTNTKELKELEKKKSDLNIIKTDTLSVLNPNEKDQLLRRASMQFDQQQNLLKFQQQQLLAQQQLLEKQQQIIQQQMQQQLIAQQAQIQLAQSQKQEKDKQQQPLSGNSLSNASNGQANNTQPNEKHVAGVQKAQLNLPPLKKTPNSSPSINNAPNSPFGRAKKGENDVNTSFEAQSVKSEKPQSILKKKNNDLNSSFNSDQDTQKSKQKKKVKFKESVFKKQSKKKK